MCQRPRREILRCVRLESLLTLLQRINIAPGDKVRVELYNIRVLRTGVWCFSAVALKLLGRDDTEVEQDNLNEPLPTELSISRKGLHALRGRVHGDGCILRMRGDFVIDDTLQLSNLHQVEFRPHKQKIHSRPRRYLLQESLRQQ